MAQFVNMFPVDLANGPALKTLNQMHSTNVKANRIGAIVTNNGAPVTLSGTCSGTAILADHTTVALTGAISGNQAYVELASACYTVEGPIHVFVTCTDTNGSTTLVAASGYVRATETDTTIDPGTIIPSVSQLIQAIEDAVDSIPADYSSLLVSIAPIFSTEDAYSAGDYVWHSGSLYRAIDNVPAGSWNASLFEPVVVTAEGRFTVGGNHAVLLQRTEKRANRFISYDVGNALQDHVGETISVSFDMKASTSRQIRVNPYQNAGYSIEDTVYFTPSSDYARFSFTTKVKNYGAVSGVSHNGRIGFYDEAGDNTIAVKNFKIELGNVATPWQMSAQDAMIAAQGIVEDAGATVAPVETGATASRNYAIGDWLIWKNVLYKATATIASGDTLAVGTNLAADSVSTEIAIVKSDLAKVSAGLLTPEKALTRQTYIQNGSFSYSARTIDIQDGVLTYTGRASGGTDWITIFISGDFSTSAKGIDSIVPPIGTCLPIALLDGVTHLQLYRETDIPGALWFAIFFCSVNESNTVSVLSVIRPALNIAEGSGPLKTTPLTIPNGATHFAIGFYSTRIADLRNTTTKVIPLFKVFPTNV